MCLAICFYVVSRQPTASSTYLKDNALLSDDVYVTTVYTERLPRSNTVLDLRCYQAILLSPFLPSPHILLSTSEPISNSQHDTRVVIPAKHRVLPILRPRILHISPPLQKVLMGQHQRKLARNDPVYALYHRKIRGEKDIEEALMYLSYHVS